MTRLVVTGAAGFIGSHLVDSLLAAGHDVVGVDNFDPFYARALKQSNLEQARTSTRFTLIEGDVRSADLPLEADTVVVHLAAKAGVRPSIEAPAEYAIHNIEGTLRLLMRAQQAGVRRIVFGSSSSVYGDTTPAPYREDAAAMEPVSPYGVTKRAGELFCATFSQLYALRIAVLRFFTVYGPRQRPDLAIHRFTRLLSQGAPVPMFGDGTSERDYTYITDIVDGITRAIAWTEHADPACEIFNLGCGKPIRLDELIACLGERLGVAPEIDQHSPQPGDVRRTVAELSKSTAVLGYRPTTSITTGVDRFVTWYQETYGSHS